MGRVKQVLTHWLEGFRSKNIQYTIALAFTGITLVAMTLVGIVLYTGFFSSAETMMKENNTRLVEQIGLNLDMYLKNMMRVSETAYYRVIKKHDLAVDDIGEQIELLYDANKDLLVSIVILDPEGNVLTSAPAAKEKEAQTAKDQAWFREALDKIENFHFSLPHVQNLFDDPDCRYRWVVSLSRAVELTENGQLGLCGREGRQLLWKGERAGLGDHRQDGGIHRVEDCPGGPRGYLLRRRALYPAGGPHWCSMSGHPHHPGQPVGVFPDCPPSGGAAKVGGEAGKRRPGCRDRHRRLL
ncbi:cache domain-containing protein [Pseudoflavonifractor sp. An176]|uniref:cache domain-containing protein n=1 Tax=Pseudoflavonifractor sp. An176 TaxID=1965572 RepID=UPI0013024850|nr:cache domain-containing protein [Pseudoflavonifractor sp. An176]